ncbi:M20/M25/M40 family metallo-hydrolase [Actinomadura darangshiensis]|uniref:M20/M25/M40 family metallo-hydrolase n=1 Tax=Actinomadura darangshiensis TaxID=705336 RepID=A0A4R5BNU3_9ACTN|nr:M20/M25/M40 family metallo-hydrolase [Actinomadura darangshiensis]TDD86840.1 M20/M25/M40 family metallo-hydrolase [Actinomadura darangshiensis]
MRAWLRVPSFSDTGEGIDTCAAFTRDLLGRIAADATVVPTAGHPVVVGTVPSADPDAPTLLVYGLYDVTPTIAAEWTVDPFDAPLVDAGDIGLLPHLGQVLVGRGANNHKGPVLAAILAVKALLDSGASPPANLVFVIEGEEEIGSPSLPHFLETHRDLLAPVKGVWLPCMQQNSSGVMTLRRAYKGSLWTELSCVGGRDGAGGPRDGRHLWAGHSAWMDAPMMRLVRALASLFDDRQRVTVDGLAERVRPPMPEDAPEVRRLTEAFDANPQWERNMLANLNAAGFMGGQRLSAHLAHYMLGTTLNIQGITGGYQGPDYYTMMPGRAHAKLDFRFPPGIEPAELAGLVQAHLDRRGYADVRVAETRGYPGSPGVPDDRDTLLQAARSTAQARGVPVDVWPIANNCCPAAMLTRLDRDVPFSVAGTGHGDRAHAPDEYITAGSVRSLMDWTVDFIHAWARIAGN